MIEDKYFAELRSSVVWPENKLYLSQDHNAPAKPITHAQKMANEMIVGPWYLDEFGNPTREIRARD
jgi:hypothetical protein